MSTFEYTHLFSPDSTAIDNVFYNLNASQALVEFVSGDQWLYLGVDEDTYDDWANEASAGRFYQNHVRGNFTGHPAYVTDHVEIVKEPVKPVSDSSVSLRAFNLSGVALNDYTVHWTLQGAKREAKVSAPNEDKAIETFNWAAELMDLTEFVKIKAVTRHFV